MIIIKQYIQAQDYTVEDNISEHQTNNAFNSLTDGQPGPPFKPMVSFIGSYKEPDFHYQTNIGMTFARKDSFEIPYYL